MSTFAMYCTQVSVIRSVYVQSVVHFLFVFHFLFFLQFLLECPDDILAFQFSPSNPNIIVGGCLNGQVIFVFLFHLSCLLYSEKFKIVSFFTQVCSLAHYKILLSLSVMFHAQVLPSTDSFCSLTRVFQILLWDISAHVTFIQATQPSSRKESSNSDKFVSTNIYGLCQMPEY